MKTIETTIRTLQVIDMFRAGRVVTSAHIAELFNTSRRQANRYIYYASCIVPVVEDSTTNNHRELQYQMVNHAEKTR